MAFRRGFAGRVNEAMKHSKLQTCSVGFLLSLALLAAGSAWGLPVEGESLEPTPVVAVAEEKQSSPESSSNPPNKLPSDPHTNTPTHALPDPRREARRVASDRLTLTRPEEILIRRPDRERPKKQLIIPLFGRPLMLGGRYTLLPRYEGSKLLDFDYLDLDNQDIDGDLDFLEIEDAARGLSARDDQWRINQGLQTDLFYAYSDQLSVYLEMKFFWRNLVSSDAVVTGDDWLVERGEMWLYLGNLFDSPFGLQVGRQRYFDSREWWWDQDLDSVRFRFDLEKVHAEIAVAHEIFPVVLNRGGIDPEDNDVVHVLGSASWAWAQGQEVGLFALYREDYSNQQSVDPQCVADIDLPPGLPPGGEAFFRTGCVAYEDDSDVNLTWLGVSAEGRVKIPKYGRVNYWFEAAGVVGSETYTNYSGETGARKVTAVDTHDVSGGGFDIGATWVLPVESGPSVTAGYAYGSGDSGMTQIHDTGFRQTGFQDNSDRFRGVASFRYYGELLDPEVSNLHIVTTGFGFRFLKKSSIDFLYHWYRQAEAAPFMRDVGFKRDPSGLSPDIGQEWDMILGIEDWNPFEFKIVGSIFRPGDAFGPEEGDLSCLFAFRFRYNF